MKNIILYGAPAAGKGTQCELLVERLGYKHISTGELFRSLDDSTEFGRKVHETIAKGILIDDETTATLVKNKLDEIEGPVVLDGFPRTLNQAKLLDGFFDNYVAMNIEVSEETALKRTLGRRNCPKCGRIYNIYTSMKPKQENTCDDCGCELKGRSDDNEESFKVRFETYLANVESVLDYYREKNLLYIIPSYESKEETYADIKKILDDQE